MKFQRERAHDVWGEMMPLFEKHWHEIAHYKDIMLDPDIDSYLKMEDLGGLRVFTARDDNNKMVGYAVYFVRTNPHYRMSIQAAQDIIFIDPTRRGMFGGKFILWCDEQLKNEGVQVVYQHIKVKTTNTIKLFEHLGYEPIDMILGKRLDREEQHG